MKIDWKTQESKIVDIDELLPNTYNPNKMPKKEMRMLKDCISKYGFLFPIIVTWLPDVSRYMVIDGYHRRKALQDLGVKEISIIDMKISYRNAIQLTVLMNRIKGMHQVELMSDLVVNLTKLGLPDEEICHNLGMEAEEYIRLKQQLGIAVYYKNHEYSKSWEKPN